MNFKTTLVLLVVLLLAGAAWMFWPARSDTNAVETEEPTPAPGNMAYVFDPQPERDAIVRVELARADKPTLVFERGEDDPARPGAENWQLVEPVSAPVESWAVRSIVSLVTNLQSRLCFEPGTNNEPTATEAGFDPPVAVVTLVDDSDGQFKLEVGKQVVMSNDTYVRIAGQSEICIANRDLRPQLEKDLNELRSKQLVNVRPDETVQLEIHTPDQSYLLSRGADRAWVLEKPVRTHAAEREVRSLLTRFNSLRATEFLDDAGPLSALGLTDPFLQFSVTTERQVQLEPDPAKTDTQPAEPQYETVTEVHELAFGDFANLAQDQRYVKPADADWVATIGTEAVADLLPDLKNLRDPKITRLRVPDIRQVELKTPDAEVTLQKNDGRWTGTGAVDTLDDTAVTEMLETLCALEAIDYVEQPAELTTYGLDQPRATYRITAAGLVEPLVVHIGNLTPSERNAYVKRGNDPTVMVVRAAQANRLTIDVLALRARQIFDFPPKTLQHLSVQRPAMSYELVRSDQRWQLQSPPDAPVNHGTVRTFVNDLAHLRARRVVARQDTGEFGFNDPLTSTTIRFDRTLADPTSTQPAGEPDISSHTLHVSRRDGIAYARRDNEPFVYELEESVFRSLTAELINTRLFDFNADQIQSVTISAPGGTLPLTRTDGEWTYTPDPFVKLSQQKVNEFANDIANLRAEAYFAWRDGDLAAEQLADPPAKVEIKLNDSTAHTLHLTPEFPGAGPCKAGLVQTGAIVRLRPGDCQKLMRGLDEYLPAETTPQPAP